MVDANYVVGTESAPGQSQQAPKSYPAGYDHLAPDPRAMAHAKLEAAAKRRNGRWDQNEEYRHYATCTHGNPKQCDKCWTPETAARWAFAVGLTDKPGPMLDKPEPPGKGRPNAPARDLAASAVNGEIVRVQ